LFAIQSHNRHRQALAIGFAGFVNVDSALCLFYYLNCLGHLFQAWDFEYSTALMASYPSVSSAAVEQPSAAASWAFGDNLHQ